MASNLDHARRPEPLEPITGVPRCCFCLKPVEPLVIDLDGETLSCSPIEVLNDHDGCCPKCAALRNADGVAGTIPSEAPAAAFRPIDAIRNRCSKAEGGQACS